MELNDDFLQNITEDDINSVTEDNTHMDGIIRGKLSDWFDNSEMSPQKFKKNIVIGTDVYQFGAILIYRPTDLVKDSLYICSASLKSASNVFEEFKADSDAKPVEKLIIYGHIDDLDDEFNSRLDERLVDSIGRNFRNKYDSIELCGAFKNIESMQYVITELYERMIDKNPFSRVWLNLGSKTRDDDGVVKTIASMINSNYIDEHIIKNKDIVEYTFKRFDRSMFARLFTKDLNIQYNKQLFDEKINDE